MSKRLNFIAAVVWAASGGLWSSQSKALGLANFFIAAMYGYILWPTLAKADEAAKEVVVSLTNGEQDAS